MSKWLIGGVAAVAALAGAAGAVGFLGAGPAPAAGVPEANAAQPPMQPPQPAPAAPGTYQIDEKMPFASATWKHQFVLPDGGKKDLTLRVEASARRRLTPGATVYFVRLRFPVEDPDRAAVERSIEIVAEDAEALAAFLDKPLGELPPEAKKGKKALMARAFLVRNCFDVEFLTVEYEPEKGEFTDAYLTDRDGKEHHLILNPKLLAETIRAGAKQFETLKAFPVKR